MTRLARFFAALSLAALVVLTVSLTASVITRELAARGSARVTGGLHAVEQALVVVSLPVFVLASMVTAAIVLWETRNMGRRRSYRLSGDGARDAP